MVHMWGLRRVTRAGGAVVCTATLVLLALAGSASAAVTPDSACQTESTFKSRDGVAPASLTIINNTGEVLQSFWLDYDGKRVFYTRVQPFTSYVQATWITHPWVIANLQGGCYRFLVMNSVAQTVTVNADAGASTQTAPPPTNTSSERTPGTRERVPDADRGPSRGDSSFPSLPVVGGAAALVALLGGLAATGHLPGVTRMTMFGGGAASANVAEADPAKYDKILQDFIDDTLKSSPQGRLDALKASLLTDTGDMTMGSPPSSRGAASSLDETARMRDAVLDALSQPSSSPDQLVVIRETLREAIEQRPPSDVFSSPGGDPAKYDKVIQDFIDDTWSSTPQERLDALKSSSILDLSEGTMGSPPRPDRTAGVGIRAWIPRPEYRHEKFSWAVPGGSVQ